MNSWAFKRWLIREIERTKNEYRRDLRTYECDKTVLPYFMGRTEALEKVLRVLTGKELPVR